MYIEKDTAFKGQQILSSTIGRFISSYFSLACYVCTYETIYTHYLS